MQRKDARVVIPKQSSQPNIEHNNFFHIPPKQRLAIKQTVPTSKSIEEKRYKQHKNNISENNNNRTNSSSKSRVSAFATMQIEDDSINGLKLRKIVGDSHILSSNILQQLSKQNLTSNFTSDSQSPGQRKQIKKHPELWTLNSQIQQTLLTRKNNPRYEYYREILNKQLKLLLSFKQHFLQLSELNDVSIQIINNLFDLFTNISVQTLIEQEIKTNELIDQLRRDKDIYESNFKQLEQERDILLETIKQLKTPKNISTQSNQNIDCLDTLQLKDMQNVMQQKIQEMSEKEAKLIKLVLAIKRSGVDIEKIYNEEVLNDDSITENNEKQQNKKVYYERSVNDADNSVVNDSDESSFCFLNRFDNDSIVESVRNFEYKSNHQNNKVKLKLDLTNLQKKNKQTQDKQTQDKQIQKPIHKIKIPDNQNNIGFHQEFMQKLNEFSESWRVQALKDDKRTKS